GLRLGHARGDGADADLRNELYADPRFGIRVLQIVDQLRDVFNRVDVVMRRRRDQLHAGRGVAQLGDVLRYLAAGQLPAFAGLRARARVRTAADAVHGHRENRVRLGRDRAERHRAGGEALDDLGGGLHFLERQWRGGKLEVEEPAEREEAPRLVVD